MNLALSLLVTRVRADHPQAAATLNAVAMHADLFD